MKSRIRTKGELDLMRKSGEISAKALKEVIGAAKEGVSLLDLEKIATDEIVSLGGKSSFKSVPGYSWTTCLTVNDEVVHGIPRDIYLKKGDKLSIDLGAVYQNWHTDTAWSVIVGLDSTSQVPLNDGVGDSIASLQNDSARDHDKLRFLRVGEEALWKGVKEAKAGNNTGDIGEVIQKTVEGAGYKVVRSLVGHGVGRELHEEPEVPGYGKKGTGEPLFEGMTIAVEVIYTESTKEVVLAEDNWTIASADGSLGGLFEMTLIVGKEGGEVLTDWRKV